MERKTMNMPNDKDKASLTAVMYNLVFMNDLTISVVFDCLTKLESSEFWRNGVKRWASSVRHEMRRYSMKFKDVIGDKMIGFIADLSDKYEEQTNIDLFKLRNACLMTLGNKPNADLASEVYIAMTFLFGSCNNNDSCLNGFPHLKSYHGRFKWMRLTNLSKAFLKLSIEFDKMLGYTYQIQLDNSNNVINGFKAIAYKLSNADNIIETCNSYAREWESAHPEFNADEV